MSKFSQYQLVEDFIKAFHALAPGNGEHVIAELEEFCKGYREGKEDVWREVLWVDGEQVQSEVSAETLAETMTRLDVKPHRGKRGGKAPAPKGWS